MGADVSVVKRTQRYLHENLEQSPVSVYDLFFNKEYSSLFQFLYQFNVGFFFFNFILFFFFFFYETSLSLHVFPIPIPPPTSLSTHSL